MWSWKLRDHLHDDALVLTRVSAARANVDMDVETIGTFAVDRLFVFIPGHREDSGQLNEISLAYCSARDLEVRQSISIRFESALVGSGVHPGLLIDIRLQFSEIL